MRENHLIERLPASARRRLLALGEPVPLQPSEVLAERGDAARYVHFPTDGLVALQANDGAGPGLSVGMVGREGMLGVQCLLGVPDAPQRAVVQEPGAAWRIDARALAGELAGSPSLCDLLHRYLYVLLVQQSTLATCLRYHHVGPRLARWLLMSRDRAQTERLHVTHELLAQALGVRRAGITMAAGGLQRRGLISYHRGAVAVLDRPGLEAAACSCYAIDRQAYADRLG